MANIHSFESLDAVDGEGIRFNVFFGGCPLRLSKPERFQILLLLGSYAVAFNRLLNRFVVNPLV